jgi:protein involved in polysaccharide export with SLBB domain
VKVYATLKSDPPLTFLEFSIGKIKNINVTVAGNVQFPGNYVVNPSVNLTNLLITAGGVDTTGSLRAIKIQRNGAIIDSVDLYPLISGIGLVKSFRLFDGDIVLVPPRYSTIAITGAVLRPAYFELKNQETLSQSIKYAGGLKYNTGKQIVIIRPGSDSRYVHINNLGSITLTNGDSLFVPFRQEQTLEVTLSSNIKQKSDKIFPIHFPWYNGLNVGGLINVADYDTANIRHLELVRRSSDGSGYKLVQYLSGNDLSSILNIRLEPFDHLTVQLIEAFYPAESITLTGQVQSPGEYPLLYGQEKLNSILERSGGLLPSASMASIVIMRDTLAIGSDDGNLVILPGDIINVKRSSGIVRIEGEVHKPGIFEWKPNLHAKDYLDRAGGITAFGDKKHVVYVDPYGKANRVRRWFNPEVEEGSRIIVSEKPITEANVMTDSFQQISALITSLVSIAILANTTGR